MNVTFIGTGTSQGVPVIACDCKVCKSEDIRDKRLRSSVLVEVDGKTMVIDTGPDFRQQMLRADVKHLDAVLFTHEHKDHVAGLDDVRAFNFKLKRDMDVFATEQVQNALKREFYYIFEETTYPGVPRVELHTIRSSAAFTVHGIDITPIEVMHYMMPVLGFRIGDFAYITDAKTISKEEKKKVKGCKTLVLNALRKEEHLSHFNLEEAIELAKELGAENTYLTHISHLMGKHAEVETLLPEGVHLSYDGLVLDL